jgi:type IV secretory pathway VirB3-like protein
MRQRLAAVFLLGAFLLYSPVVTLFDRPRMVMGIPMLHAYLFGVWAIVIAVLAWIVERKRE